MNSHFELSLDAGIYEEIADQSCDRAQERMVDPATPEEEAHGDYWTARGAKEHFRREKEKAWENFRLS